MCPDIAVATGHWNVVSIETLPVPFLIATLLEILKEEN